MELSHQNTPTFRRILYDIEADNLYNDITEIFCAVVVDLPTGVVKGYRPSELEDFYEVIKGAEVLVGHNILDYDNPVLAKMKDIQVDDWRCVDTIVWSRLFYPDRPGGHSLRSWGIRLNEHKGDFDDFSRFTEEMYTYCLQDGVVNLKVLEYFLKSLRWSYKDLWAWVEQQRVMYV